MLADDVSAVTSTQRLEEDQMWASRARDRDRRGSPPGTRLRMDQPRLESRPRREGTGGAGGGWVGQRPATLCPAPDRSGPHSAGRGPAKTVPLRTVAVGSDAGVGVLW